MADGGYVLQPGGDACGACEGLAGERVPGGYKVHDNCLCETVPADDGDCEYEWEQVGNNRDGSGAYDVVTGIELTVTCADGSEISESIEVDLHGSSSLEDAEARIDEAAGEAASELCAQCPEPESPNVT